VGAKLADSIDLRRHLSSGAAADGWLKIMNNALSGHHFMQLITKIKKCYLAT